MVMMKFFARVMLAASLLFVPVATFAQLGSSDTGIADTVKQGYGITGDIVSLPEFVGSYIVKPILGLTGTLLFVLMTYAGFLWITARGEAKQVTKAKDILTQCIVGSVILVGAYALANFVLTSLKA